MVFNTIILKLAARCNLDCTYCYWFRDRTVFDKPALLTESAQTGLLRTIKSHLAANSLDVFNLVFHGGEPLLFGKPRFAKLCEQLRLLEDGGKCKLSLGLTTNGVLIDSEWISLFKEFRVSVTLSIDGPRETHDRYRIDHKGEGSYSKVVMGLNELRKGGIEPRVLAVCDLQADPFATATFFARDLGVNHFDILVPDATHEDKPASIAAYYTKLFDTWYDWRGSSQIRVRFIENIAKGVLGLRSNSEAIGYGPVSTVVVLTDGSLEPLDVLRITESGSTRTGLNVQGNELQELQSDPVWKEAHDASLNLSSICKACKYRLACGGGYLPHRWSRANRFDNPSVYCDDLKHIFSHAMDRIRSDIYTDSSLEGELTNAASRRVA